MWDGLDSIVMKRAICGDVDFIWVDFDAYYYATADMPRFHQHNDIELFYVLSGPSRLSFDGEVANLPALRLGAFWGIRPHISVDPQPGTRFLGVNIPLIRFFSWNLPGDFVHTLLSGQLVTDPIDSNGPDDEKLLWRWAADFQDGDAALIRIVELEVEARLRRLAWAVGADRARGTDTVSTGASDLSRVELMARFVAERHHEAIDVTDIARAAGIHPKYAMRVFRRICGMTLLQFLTQNRIRHAQRLLVTVDSSLHEIAEAAGFGSDSRFREVFKRSCGVSPATYRAALRK